METIKQFQYNSNDVWEIKAKCAAGRSSIGKGKIYLS
jgi:hypothetical protein